MRLFGRLLMLSVWTPGPREWMCAQRAVSLLPMWDQPHTFRPWKAIFSKGPRFARLSCHLCCLGIHIKEAVGLVRLQKTGPLVFFRVVGAHVSRQKGGCKASFIYQICVQMVKLVCGCFDRLLRMKGGRADSSVFPQHSSLKVFETKTNTWLLSSSWAQPFLSIFFLSLSLLEVQIG